MSSQRRSTCPRFDKSAVNRVVVTQRVTHRAATTSGTSALAALGGTPRARVATGPHEGIEGVHGPREAFVVVTESRDKATL